MSENTKQIKVHYIHRISTAVQERIVGIFVLSAVLIIVGLVLIQIQSSHLLDDRIDYDAYLTNAQGVSTDTLINISGIEVGQVTTIDITPNNRIHVKFFVYESFQRLLRTDSTGELNKLSVIGNAAIIIKAGSHQLPILESGSTIQIEEPVSIDELMAKLTPVITSLGEIVENASTLIAAIEPDKLQLMAGDLSALVSNLLKISEQVASGNGLAGKLIYDEQLVKDVTKPLKKINEIVNDISPIVKGVNPIVRDTGQIVAQIKKNMKRVESILKETELRMKEVSAVIEPATNLANTSNEIAADLKSTTQLVGDEVKQLPDMVNKMQNLLDTTNRTIKNAQEVWPLSTMIPPGNKDTVIKAQPLDD